MGINYFSKREDSNYQSKYVFKIKIKLDETIDKYKTRLVARGFLQIHGVDYIKSFSPIIKLN
jgi:hypothetical protein